MKQSMSIRRSPPPHLSSKLGFTLVEVLAAIAVMSVLTLLAWRGIDAMVRAQEGTSERSRSVMAMQSSLAQWALDLDHAVAVGQVPAIQWDGLSLRITRLGGAADPGQLRVVAWSLRGPGDSARWLRWESPPVSSRSQIMQAWERANAWAQNAGEAERRLEIDMSPVSGWQVFFYRGESWTHPLSTGGSGGADSAVPDGVRLVLRMGAGSAFADSITRDWVNPTMGGGKS